MFSFAIKHLLYVKDICNIIDKYLLMDDSIEGISFLGGEPIYQIKAMLAIASYVKDNHKKSCILFSGFTLEEISKLEEWDYLKPHLDLGIFGRFDENKKTSIGFPSSSNQEVLILNEKYKNISTQERNTILLYDFKNKFVLQTGYPVVNKIFNYKEV